MEFLPPFLIGGITVSGIKYLSNRVDPKYAAILGAFPIGLLSTYYITDMKNLSSYLDNYIKIIIIVAFSAFLYIQLLKNKINRTISFILSLIFWLTCIVIKTFFLS